MIPAWQPVDGGTVHIAPGNDWHLPSGRYQLRHYGARAWDILTASGPLATNTEMLVSHHAAGILTPISAAELERDRQVLALRCKAPLRGPMRAQHDCSDLALFSAGTAPTLL